MSVSAEPLAQELLAHAIAPDTLLLSRYRVIRKIAEGTVASVYLARDERTEEPVALKVFDPLRSADPMARMRFEREFQILSRTRHPGVARAIAFEQAGDLDVLVLEYIEGECLADRMQRGTLAAEDAITIVIRLGEALDACHRAGVIHRDLKPTNVILSPARGPVIIDFGVAWFSSAMTLTRTGAIVGSPRYVAPETFACAVTDERVDVYALGAILFEMLTGRPVRDADSVVELARIEDGPPPPVSRYRPEIPDTLDSIIGRAIAFAPELRFATARELVDALRRGSLGRAKRLEATMPCPKCHTPAVVDLPICPGCGKNLSWHLEAGPFAVQLIDVSDPVKTVSWLRRRHGDTLALPWRALARRLRHPPVPLVIGVSYECALALSAQAGEVGCRAEILQTRRLLGPSLATPDATAKELTLAVGYHFFAAMVVAVVIGLAALPIEATLLVPAVVSLAGLIMARRYVRRPVLQVPQKAQQGETLGQLMQRISERLKTLSTARARGLAASAISRGALLLMSPQSFDPEDHRHAVETLDEALCAAAEVDLHAAVLADVHRSTVTDPQALADLTEISVAHDLAARRALEACEELSRLVSLN